MQTSLSMRTLLRTVTGASRLGSRSILPVLMALAVTCSAAEPARVRVLLLTGESDYPSHDWRSTTPFLRNLLERAGRFDVKVAEEVRGLNAQSLASYDVLVLNYNGPRWGEATEKAVEDFVRGGKGMVAVHAVSYGPFFGMEQIKGRWIYAGGMAAGWSAYPDLLGAAWKPENIGHAARHAFSVKWIDPAHPISRDLPEVFTVSDELYHRLDLRPGARVLASAYDDPKVGGTGKDEPILWTVDFGKGRVVHTPLGHDTSAMYADGFQMAFARSCEWAATGAVTLPPTPRPAPAVRPVRALVVTGGHSYPASFYTLFEGQEDIAWSHAANQAEAFTPKMTDLFDVVILHDMYEQIGPKEQANLRAFVENGKGVVSLHHSIVDYTSWPWWQEEVTGGKFFTQASPSHGQSEYKEGVDFVVRPARGLGGHVVTRGIGPLVVHDETYRNMWRSDRITVLMETDEPRNDRPVVYIGPHPRSRVIYIQLGHGDATMRHPGFRKLVRNAILWSARRLD
jgi:type 1 glutamine amidotransferase